MLLRRAAAAPMSSVEVSGVETVRNHVGLADSVPRFVRTLICGPSWEFCVSHI